MANSGVKYFNGDIWRKLTHSDLSYYATKADMETFAAAFAEATTSRNPRGYAKIFMEELEKAMKK